MHKEFIPALILQKLEEDTDLFGAVLQTFMTFKEWLDNSGMPFFREYTDHGMKHLKGVLITIQSLISDDLLGDYINDHIQRKQSKASKQNDIKQDFAQDILSGRDY